MTSTGRFLENVKEGFHILVAVVLIIESCIFLATYFREHLLPEWLLAWVNANITIILLSSLAVSLIFLFAMFLQLRDKTISLTKASADLGQHSRQREELRLFVEKYQTCQQGFRTLAHKSAQCDKEIFDLLRSSISNEQGKLAVERIRTRINVNIIEVLDSAADIFRAFTEDECAVCIKVMIKANTPGKDDGAVSIVARNSTSRADRAAWPASSRTGESTEDVEIFSKHDEFFMEDDLIARSGSRQYVSAVKDWHAHYRAMAATRITPLAQLGHAQFILAALYIDNKKGNLNNQHCRHFIRELAWRLSIVLYELYWAELGSMGQTWHRENVAGQNTLRITERGDVESVGKMMLAAFSHR